MKAEALWSLAQSLIKNNELIMQNETWKLLGNKEILNNEDNINNI